MPHGCAADARGASVGHPRRIRRASRLLTVPLTSLSTQQDNNSRDNEDGDSDNEDYDTDLDSESDDESDEIGRASCRER